MFPGYRERLTAPLRWWVLGGLFVASVWAAFAVATPPPLALAATVIAAGLVAGWLVGYGRPLVEVGPEGLRAHRALLPWAACGNATELGSAEFRTLRGPAADARAYLLLRPYLEQAVRVDVRDPLDPTPYWLLATRHPGELAAAVRAARDRAELSGS